MKYFKSLPLISVTNGINSQVYRNLMTRLSVKPSVLKNPLVYYSYDIKDGDTPEIIAHKYYGDSYRYWIVLFSNEYLDPQWDWPMKSQALEQYIVDKYVALGISPTDTKSYQKIITQHNSVTGETTTNTVEISQEEYDTLSTSNDSYSFAGETVSVSITKKIQTYYEYELELNEAKRNIKLLNRDYVSQLESEFTSLLS